MKLWSVFLFLLKFSLFAGILHFLLWLNLDTTGLQETVANAVARILRALGYDASSDGAVVRVDSFGMEIIRDCLGWKSVLALLGLIFATPSICIKSRIYGALIGTAVILSANMVRLVTTAIIGVKLGYEGFELVHMFLWRWGLMAVVLACWLIWLNRSR